MPELSTSESWSSWRGSRAYILTALVASAANVGSLDRLSSAVTSVELNDVRDLLNSLTVVTMAAFFIQFVMARALGVGHRLRIMSSFYPALGSAACAALVSYVLVQSTDDYRAAVAGSVSLFTFLAVVVSARAATLLANARWLPICTALAGSTTTRLVLFQITFFNQSPVRILGALIIGQVVNFAVLSFSKVSDLELSDFRLSALASRPAGMLGSYLVLIASATIARAGSLGGDKQVLIVASTPARSAFFFATSVAYAAFPMISGLGLFSRELGKTFREAQIAVTSIVAILVMSTASAMATGHDIRGVIDVDTPHSLALELSIGWGLLALTLLPTLFYVAHNSGIGLLTLVPAVVMLMGQALCTTAGSFAKVFLGASAVLAAIALAPALMRTRPVVRPEKAHSQMSNVPNAGDVMIVVPSYNSGSAGAAIVRSIYAALSAEQVQVSVIAVSDGSSDESVHAFNEIREPWFEHITLPENRGKGAALKAGFERSHGGIIGFIDADGDIAPEMLPNMIRILRATHSHIVFGSKLHPDSEVDVSLARRAISKLQQVIQLVLFRINISDTQVGVKVFDGRMIKTILPTLGENGFSLDLEIFVSAVAHGYTQFVEVPVSIVRRGKSSVTVQSILQSAADVFRIFWRSRVGLRYHAMAYENAKTQATVGE